MLVCLKYLKSLLIEFGNIIDILNCLVLVYLDISFCFLYNGKFLL